MGAEAVVVQPGCATWQLTQTIKYRRHSEDERGLSLSDCALYMD